jgi:hypothetical protein
MKSMFRKGSDYGDTETGTDNGDDGEECGDINCEADRYNIFHLKNNNSGFSHHYTKLTTMV